MTRNNIFTMEDLRDKLMRLLVDFCNANKYPTDEDIHVEMSIDHLNQSLQKESPDTKMDIRIVAGHGDDGNIQTISNHEQKD